MRGTRAAEELDEGRDPAVLDLAMPDEAARLSRFNVDVEDCGRAATCKVSHSSVPPSRRGEDGFLAGPDCERDRPKGILLLVDAGTAPAGIPELPPRGLVFD